MLLIVAVDLAWWYILSRYEARSHKLRKFIITVCNIGSILIILDSIQAGHSLVLFLFVGLIPGTNTYLSPIDMMAAMATAMTVIILRATLWPRFRTIFFTMPTKRKNSARNIA